MRRISTTLFLAFATLTSTTFSSCSQEENIISDTLQEMIDENNNLISELENLIDELQTDVDALQKISEAIKERRYITSVTENKENGKIVSYTITFSFGDPIEIKVGQDGKDGTDGKDGVTPQLRISDEGYWEVSYDNGKNWSPLTDSNNKPIPATGKDGVTPQLKIENGEWMVSYDGEDWQSLGIPATGKDGENGTDGTNGVTPVIGVQQEDGIYYWTVNGDWLLDGDNKIPVTGEDGKNGGTPVIGVQQDENDGIYYWTVNGNWLLDKNGNKIRVTGTDGTSFFSNVVPDSNGDYIIIILADGVSSYKIPTEQGYHKEQVLQIQSLTYLPTSPDGKAEVYKSKSNYLLNLDFIVSPKENASSIIELLNNDSITIKLIATTTTRSDFMTMSLYGTPTLEEDTGILSLTINASDAYDTLSKGGSMAAALSIEITINDVTKTITSDFIALKLAQ